MLKGPKDSQVALKVVKKRRKQVKIVVKIGKSANISSQKAYQVGSNLHNLIGFSKK